MYLEFELIC